MVKGRSVEEWYSGDYNQDSMNKAVHIYWQKAFGILKRFNRERRPLKLLDIGCDDGVLSSRLKSLGYDVYGMDIRKKEVVLARKLGIKAVVGNAEKRFPFRECSFDAALAGDIIEHIFDTDFFIGEASRILKPGGLLVVTTPNLASLSNRVRLMFGKIPVGSEIRLGKDMAGHIRNYTFPALERQLREHGFAVVKKVSSNVMFPVRYNVPVLTPLAVKLGDYVSNIGSHIIIAARKV
ncbi:TPA: class I SAM-dependent methyltransferase [Candidatus Woesearchaeota archaeon]|nr:class I SAM-dependent methyltransferase [Candidatus Woesearchaeota archaeon]